VASLPAGIVMSLGSEIAWQSPQGQDDWWAVLVLGLGQLFDGALAALLVALAGTVFAMMYLNARFRQEALDAVLLDAAGEAETAAGMLPRSPEHLGAHFSTAPGRGRS